MLQRLRDWGVRRASTATPATASTGCNLAFHERRRRARVHPDAPRGARRLRRVRAREAHRRGRRVHGDLGPGRDPSAQRALRRQARPRAGASRSSASRRGCRSAATTSRRSTSHALFKDVAGEYLADVHRSRAGARTSSTARCGSRMARRTVTAIIVPNDVQELALRGAAARARRRSTPAAGLPRPGRPARRRRPAPRRRACSTRAQRSRCSSARAPGAPPTRSSRSPSCSAPAWPRRSTGAPSLPDDLPFVTGSIGLLGHQAVGRHDGGLRHAADGRHALPYSEWLPEPGQARGVQIDIDAGRLGMRYPMEVAMAGDAAATLRALVPLLERKAGPRVARGDRGGRRALVAAARGARPGRGRPDQPAARLPRALRAPARRRDRPRGLGLGDQLVGAPPAPARTGWTPRCAGRWRRCARRCPTRWRPSWPSRGGRSSRASATARCRCSASTP